MYRSAHSADDWPSAAAARADVVRPMNPNYEYFMNGNFRQYAGEWIIIARRRVVAHGPGRRMPAMMRQTKEEYPGTPLFVAKIPRRAIQIL